MSHFRSNALKISNYGPYLYGSASPKRRPNNNLRVAAIFRRRIFEKILQVPRSSNLICLQSWHSQLCTRSSFISLIYRRLCPINELGHDNTKGRSGPTRDQSARRDVGRF